LIVARLPCVEASLQEQLRQADSRCPVVVLRVAGCTELVLTGMSSQCFTEKKRESGMNSTPGIIPAFLVGRMRAGKVIVMCIVVFEHQQDPVEKLYWM
jgi:hypothetical protein